MFPCVALVRHSVSCSTPTTLRLAYVHKPDEKRLSLIPGLGQTVTGRLIYGTQEPGCPGQVDAAKARGITVTNTPGVLTEDTADVTMALILAVPRRIAEGDALARSGRWHGWSPTGMLGHRINGKRLGIIGMGATGQAIARRARGFGMSIHYHNRKPVQPGVEESLEATYWESLDQMLPRMDIVSVNCPSTEATRNLLNEERIGMLNKNAYLINTARGDVVDEAAMIAALQSGSFAGAGLDVYADEPDVPEALRALRNVVLLPHIGSATIEGRDAMGDKVLINIQTFIDGHTPPDRVLAAML